MKFIDLVNITVIAGNGGNGCVSFKKRSKRNFSGKPDGSNGGDGGDVWLLSDSNINTLCFFNSNRIFRAGHGDHGRSRNCTGKRGKDIIIRVPVGTRVFCQKTRKLLRDMIDDNNRLMVAKGGRHGLGNRSFKYSFNSKNAFCCKIKGFSGQIQYLFLELFLIADVGVFGLPNSGKSSFVRAISNAKPKVADYPFTTLIPRLGVVKMDNYDSNRFIIADIPGIIKGASTGSGLGLQFLKHLKRCYMLLHFVDISAINNSNPIENIISIKNELNSYDCELTNKTQWLIFNKMDLLDEYESNKKINFILQSLEWEGRYYTISVKQGTNISLLCYDIMKFVNNGI